MKHRHKRSIPARTPVVWFCLLVFCNPSVGSEADASAAPVDKAATSTTHVEGQTDVPQEDVVDRIFAPLDDAVSDINRDINKDDTDTTPEPGE